jgi:hypothetical protein
VTQALLGYAKKGNQMKPETQVNIYWSGLLQKWVGEVVELTDQERCVFYKEDADWDLVVSKISGFLLEQTRFAGSTKYA